MLLPVDSTQTPPPHRPNRGGTMSVKWIRRRKEREPKDAWLSANALPRQTPTRPRPYLGWCLGAVGLSLVLGLVWILSRLAHSTPPTADTGSSIPNHCALAHQQMSDLQRATSLHDVLACMMDAPAHREEITAWWAAQGANAEWRNLAFSSPSQTAPDVAAGRVVLLAPRLAKGGGSIVTFARIQEGRARIHWPTWIDGLENRLDTFFEGRRGATQVVRFACDRRSASTPDLQLGVRHLHGTPTDWSVTVPATHPAAEQIKNFLPWETIALLTARLERRSDGSVVLSEFVTTGIDGME
jgi:hypothetical protein